MQVIVVDDRSMDGTAEWLRTRPGAAEDDVLVSYAGAVGMAHGLGTVLEAAARLGQNHPRARFLIVLAWTERDTIRSKAADWALSNLSLTGLVPWERARDIVAASDVSLVALRN